MKRSALAALLALCTCCKASPERPASNQEDASAVPSGEASAVSEVARPPATYPADLSLEKLEKALACRRGSTKGACRIVEDFAKSQRFTGKTPSGESRWLGRASVVEGGKESTEFLVLYIHTVPTVRVGANSLPLMLGMSPLPQDANGNASRVFGTLSRGRHRANRKDLVMRLVETYEPKVERGLINTTGESVQTIGAVSEDISFIRQPELKRLLLVKPSLAMDAKPGDGTYAEFWQTAW